MDQEEILMENKMKKKYYLLSIGKSIGFFAVLFALAFTWKTKVGYFAFVIAISIGILASYLGGFRHYRESPSSLKITKNNLVIHWGGIFGNTKESESIAWNNISDCTPKSHWIIRTRDGSKFDLRTVDDEIIQRIYNYWKDKNVAI